MTTPEHIFFVTVPLMLSAFFIGRVWELRSSKPWNDWMFERAQKMAHKAIYEKQMREAAEEHAEMWRKHAKRMEGQVRR